MTGRPSGTHIRPGDRPPAHAAGELERRLAEASAVALREMGAGSCAVLLPDPTGRLLLAAGVAVTPTGSWALDSVRLDDPVYATARAFRTGEVCRASSRVLLDGHPELAAFALYPFVAASAPVVVRGTVRAAMTAGWTHGDDGPDRGESALAAAAARGMARELAALEDEGVPIVPPRCPLVVPGYPAAPPGPDQSAEVAAPSHFHLRKLAERLMSALSVAQIADAAVDRLAHGFRVPAAAITLLEGGRLRLIGAVGCSPEYLAALTDPAAPAELPEWEAVARGQRRFLRRGDRRVAGRGTDGAAYSWGVLPLRAGGRIVGTCSIGFTAERPDTLPEQSSFTAMSSLLGHTLERARLAEQQYDLVRGLQQALLPAAGPGMPRLRVVDRYRPATGGLEIGGDWYDVIDRGEDGVMLVIGDVEGHSSTAAVLMGQLRSAVRAYTAEGHGPGTVLGRTNELMIGLDAGLFATCCCLALDPVGGTARMATAGHPPPLVRGPSGGYLDPSADPGPPLGVQSRVEYRTADFTVEPGSLLALFTDGISPAGRLDTADLECALAAGGGLEGAGDLLMDRSGPQTGTGPGGVPAGVGGSRGDDAALLTAARPAG